MASQPAVDPPAAVITAGGVFIPGHLAEPLWRALRDEIRRRSVDGGRVRPEVAQAVEALRAAALNHMSANGDDVRRFAETAASSEQKPYLTTAELAARLKVSDRHARHLTWQHGIKPFARNLWAAEDVAALAAQRGAAQ